jgi:hypothetical protein
MLIILYSAYTICLLNDESKPTLQRKNEEIWMEGGILVTGGWLIWEHQELKRS